MLVVITFTSDKHFGLDDIGWRGLEMNEKAGRMGEALSAAIPTFHGTPFHGLSTVITANLYARYRGSL
jgi:hypothetical protein